ncbi:aldo/keto reductase [Oceanobacillus bengalensis]|uniref:Aldo/keto reductase n=1 Tax=Oceanobacillus bengalensis TaxID=1435466 RepID=A0A494Z0L8_9BACI|nr:aldo/keto reductase [Oceanobacillus bengalensis]RKQ16081.1 aldo/keto reductase [Oceanobacillus bengalensis]
MKKNQLGKSGIYVSELTLGCMSLGTDKQVAKRIIDLALDKGINHIDTADLYDFGLNEEMIGEIIHDKREDIVLTTKVGNHFNTKTKDWFWDPSKKYIIHAVKDSLKRLRTDYIDFYMLHGGTTDDPTCETIEAFEQLKQEGIIRAYGISSIRPNVIREYVQKSSIDGVMMQYNLLDRRPEEEILDLLHNHEISVLARGPLAKGILSKRADEIRMQKGNEGYLDYSSEELQSLLDKMKELVGNTYSLNRLALQYVLQHPAVTTAVFGVSSQDQLEENINEDFTDSLSENIYRELQNITKALEYKHHR